MTIYIENAIIDNMVINSLLLYFVFKTIKQTPPRWRILASALIGTGFALIMPLLTFDGVLAVAVRLFIGALMVFIVQHRSVKRYVLFYLIFLAYTFAFGGAVYGILFMMMDTHSGLQYFTYNSSVSIGLVIGVVVAFALLMRLFIKFLNVRHSISNHLRDVVIHHRGEQFKILSYMDTGNRLTDPESGAPVVVISLSLFLKMFPDISPDRILLNKLEKEGIEEGKYINFSTVAGKSKMFTFKPSKLEIIKGKTCDKVRLGVSMKGFKDVVKYDALLNASLV
ncbi:MAG: sigma-E processing peptidase SpoIIGA [Firmicutes bacterium]|nr:sigma-E processing peptidase SpoIIGA [Bacillota bacterium]